ncbi:MAG: hypothetical protein Q9185_006353 [Variospora sp. 1 TL-2023]
MAAYAGYNDLPSLQTAIRFFDNSDAESVIKTEILYLYPFHCLTSCWRLGTPSTRHQAFEKFGIQLLHRHFPLSNSHLLVEDHALTSPFPKPAPNTFPSDRIIPKSWFFGPDGTLEPYEYRIVLSTAEKEATANIGADATFAAQIHSILLKNNLLRILGLSALGEYGYPSTDTVRFEKTFHDRNIFVQVGLDEIGMRKKDVQTSLWVFIKDGGTTSQGGGNVAGAAVSKLLCISGCMCQRVEDDEGY